MCILAVLLAIAIMAAIAFMIAMVVILVDKNNSERQGHPDPEGQQMPAWPPPSNSQLGNYSSAAVVADNGICSEIGRDIIIRGGNAVDAAVAATFCIGVLDAQSAGIGGGHFMTIYNK